MNPSRAPIVLVTLAMASCAESRRSALVVEVDSDLDVPTQLDSFAFRVTGDGAPVERIQKLGTAAGQVSLPARFAIESDAGTSGVITVDVVGRLGSVDLVSRGAHVHLLPGKTILWVADLVRQ